MTFRDDREALVQRAQALESDLAEAHRLLTEVREQLSSEEQAAEETEQRLGELEGQVNDLRGQLGLQPLVLSREKDDSMGGVMVIGLGSLVVFALVLVGAVLMLATSDPTNPEPPAWVPVLFGGAFALSGLPMIGMGLATFSRDRDIKKWPQVAGKILSSRIEAYTSTEKDQYGYYRSYEYFHPDVKYGYTVGDQAYECSGISRVELNTTDRAAVQARVDRYPADADVMVLYDPDDPTVAYLEVRQSAGA